MQTNEKKLEAARAKGELLGIERENALIEAELSMLERVETLQESSGWFPVHAEDYSSGADDDFDHGLPTAGRRPYVYTEKEDRTHDRWRPWYEQESDLRRMWAIGRSLSALDSTAIGALEALADYTIGSGTIVEVEPKQARPTDKPTDEQRQVIQVIQNFLDDTLQANDFVGDLDLEIHDNTRREGEAFVAIYPNDKRDGIEIVCRDTTHIIEPANPRPLERWLDVGHKLNFWGFGVHTRFSATQKTRNSNPLGYHLVYDNAGEQWDYINNKRMQHIKRNVGRNAPRGVSDFYALYGDLIGEIKLRQNLSTGTAIQAAIALIRRHPAGTNKAAAGSIVSANADRTITRTTGTSSKTVQRRKFHPGTVIDSPQGSEYSTGPLGQLRSPVYVDIAQYLTRVIGRRWLMPEYMISGDASNANYSSTLVAESPFVKARERDQRFYGAATTKLCWKILRLAGEMELLRPDMVAAAAKLVQITVRYPAVASRDQIAQAQSNEIEYRTGILSQRTWATDAGRDYDVEVANRKEEPQPAQPPAGGGGAAGGESLPPGMGSGQPQQAGGVPAAQDAKAQQMEQLATKGAAAVMESLRRNEYP